MNEVRLGDSIVQREALRYTPAGLPAIDLRLAHTSSRVQLGQTRTITLELHASAFGELATRLMKVAVGSGGEFHGFLVKQRNGRGVMLHIEHFGADPSADASTLPSTDPNSEAVADLSRPTTT
jgi:primosomal replication protein N